MSEVQPGGFQPETGSDLFSIEGEGRRFFLDKGEKLTENPEGIEEFGGFINFVGDDGNAEKFPGGIYDKGDHWQVLRYDAVGGEYLIPKAGGAPEVRPEVGEGVVAQLAEVGPGLEDAAAVAAMEEPVGGKGDDFGGYRLAPDAKGGIANEEKLMGEIIGPDGQRFFGIVKRTPEGLKVVGANSKKGFIKTPEKEIVGRVETPAAEVSAVPSVAATAAEADLTPSPAPEPQLEIGSMFEPSPAPEQASPAEGGSRGIPQAEPPEAAVLGDRDSIGKTKRLMDEAIDSARKQKFSGREQLAKNQVLQEQLGSLREKQQGVLDRLNRARKPETIKKLSTEDSILRQEITGLEKQVAALAAPRELGVVAAENRQATAEMLLGELDQWRRVVNNSKDFEEDRGLDGRVQADLAAAEHLFGGGNPEDRAVLDAARKRIEDRAQVRRAALEAKLPRLLLELAGLQRERTIVEGQQGVDADLWQAYNEVCQQLYAELTGGPQAVQPEMPPAPAPEPILPPETVEQPVVEATAEGIVPVAEVVVEPEEVAASAAAEEAAPAPVEASVEELPAAEVVVDEEERARAEAARPARPAGTAEASIPGDQEGFDAATLDAARQQAAEAAAEALAAEEAAPASAEASAGEAETPEQRFERRKRGFAGALAELDKARGDTNGTEGEQKVRLAEAYNQAIGAAMEFMEEGDVARGAVKGFLAGVLGTPDGRKLTEIVVGDRLDQAGVTAAPAGEKRKKLEETGLLGLLELLLELGMSFTDKSIGAVVAEVQAATGGGR